MNEPISVFRDRLHHSIVGLLTREPMGIMAGMEREEQMKTSYEKRWGHPRYRKATKHLEIKAQTRREAEARQMKYDALTRDQKRDRACNSRGNCENEKRKLANIRSLES